MSAVQLGLTLTVAWGLTWLVRSRELLEIVDGGWWRRHRRGLLLCLSTVAVPFVWLFSVAGVPGMTEVAPGLALPAIGIPLGLAAGLGAGAACLPAWQVAHWHRLLRPSLAAAAACLVGTLVVFLAADTASTPGSRALSGRAVFIGLLVGMLAVFVVGLRTLRPPRLPPESWSRDDIVVAGVLFTTCLSFIPDAGTLSTLLAVLLALALDPGAIRPSRWVGLDRRRIATVLLFSPLLAFFLSAAGSLASPLTSFTVAGIHVESTGPLELSTMLSVSVVAGISNGLILLLAVGFERRDDLVPGREPRLVSRHPGRLALLALAAVFGVGTLVWAAAVIGRRVLFGSADPNWGAAATLILITAVVYGVLINGGAFIVSHTATRIGLQRLDLVPRDLAGFLGRCVDMTILQRVGDGFRFVHPLLQEHLAGRAPRWPARAAGPSPLEGPAAETVP